MTQDLNNTLVILRLKQTVDRVRLSRSTIYQLAKVGRFPRPIALTGSRSVGWLESEVQAWIAERVTASRAAKDVR